MCTRTFLSASHRQVDFLYARPLIPFDFAVALPKYAIFNLLNGNNGTTRAKKNPNVKLQINVILIYVRCRHSVCWAHTPQWICIFKYLFDATADALRQFIPLVIQTFVKSKTATFAALSDAWLKKTSRTIWIALKIWKKKIWRAISLDEFYLKCWRIILRFNSTKILWIESIDRAYETRFILRIFFMKFWCAILLMRIFQKKKKFCWVSSFCTNNLSHHFKLSQLILVFNHVYQICVVWMHFPRIDIFELELVSLNAFLWRFNWQLSGDWMNWNKQYLESFLNDVHNTEKWWAI